MDTPTQHANVFGNDNIIVQASGSGVSVTVQSGRPYLRLTQYERRTRLAARDKSETALLSAYRADVVPLIGRDREMSDLRRWLDDPAPMSIRVLIGSGGPGKTRLPLELARPVSTHSWLPAFANPDSLYPLRSHNAIQQWPSE